MQTLTLGIVIGNKVLWDEVQSCIFDMPAKVVLEQHDIGDWAAFLDKLTRYRPEVLLVELSQLADPLDDVVRQIKATPGSPAVIAVHTEASPENLLRAIRASADEYLYPPLRGDLFRALQRMSGERAKVKAGTRPRGKVFGMVSAKGGCGATTLACHLAVEMHRKTKLEVLLADFDLDTGSVGFLMKSQGRYSVLDAADNIHRLDLSFWKALVSNGTMGVEVIMAPSNPGANRQCPLEDFQHVLRFVRSNYDWTIVDLGRNLSPMVMTVLEELDELYIVTTLDIPALHHAKRMIQALHETGFGRQRMKLVLNRMPKRSEVGVDELERMLGAPVYSTVPNDYQRLYDAFAEGKILEPGSYLGKAFQRLAAKMVGAPEEPKPRRIFSLLG